ncbi:MAG: hypothetical protein H6825_12745 [Planctomycetes bacterium]|nr:hypothetical protein [Planctomycetota bacterium]
MRLTLSALALVVVAYLAPPATAQRIGLPPPELEAVKWYNAPALQLADLRERAVLVEVFRTW